jgi:hypothetical protein
MTEPNENSSLEFVRYDMSDAGSAASLFVSAASVCGIYVLEFETGERYVGQTINITKRYATHRRHHGDITAFRFAACRPDQLDALERDQVRIEEERYSLRNLNLTGWPGGRDDKSTTKEDGRSILLPWERERRGLLSNESAATKQSRFWELSQRADYEEMAETLSHFIAETLSDPFATQEVLWTLTALPSTKRTKRSRRLLTLSCSQLEVLYVGEDPNGLAICVNVDAPTFDSRADTSALPAVFDRGYDAPYRSAEVAQYVFTSWSAFDQSLEYGPFLEAAYKLNTAMMRRGAAPTRKHHNVYFASDLLRRAAGVQHEASSGFLPITTEPLRPSRSVPRARSRRRS